MKDSDIQDIQGLLGNAFHEKGFGVSHILAFLSLTYIGTLEMHGYSEEFLDKTLKRMKKQFLEKRKAREAFLFCKNEEDLK